MSGFVYFLLGALAVVLVWYFAVYKKTARGGGYIDTLETVRDIPEDESVPIVLLYKSEKCPACTDFIPKWKKVTEKISKCKSRANCMVIDVDRMGRGTRARDVFKQENVREVPTVMVLRAGKPPTQIQRVETEDIYNQVQALIAANE